MPLTIFPAYGLDNSLLTAVLIGLYVRLFFTEWLGWVFSGLVVPGYLAAVILLRPASAAVIIVEAVITFLLVSGLSRLLSMTKLGTPVFGRDRFMWLVLVSVGVRVLVEALLIPAMETWLRRQAGLDLFNGSGFYGIGLVLVPLLANACWKPGLVRGSLQQLVCTAITYWALQGLLATTNLSLASVASCFERIAVDFAASPKAYMLLLGGALLASRANLRFGWDTSGVVIPGLLCLGWFWPSRLLSTLAESLLIALVASLFVRLPRVRDWNVEGPRRVALLFTIGYVIKFIIVATLGLIAPGFTATELFGIGYLLPSLLAVKIWQRRNPTVVLLPAMNLSIGGFVIGSLVGFGLLVADARLQSRRAELQTAPHEQRCGGETSLLSEVRLARVRVARALPSAAAPRISGPELGTLEHMVRRLHALTVADKSQTPLGCDYLATQLGPDALGLQLQLASSPAGRAFFTLHEATDDVTQLRGFGLVAVAAKPHGGPVLVVERPQHDWTDGTALVALADLLGADGIVVGGLPQPTRWRGDVLRDRDVPLRVALSSLAGQPITVRAGEFERPHLSALVSADIAHALESKLGPISRGGFGRATAELELPYASEQLLADTLLPKLAHYPNVRSFFDSVLSLPSVDPAPPRSLALELLLAEEVIRPLARARTPVDRAALARRIAGGATAAGLAVALIDDAHADSGGQSSAGSGSRIAIHGYGEAVLIQPDSPDGPLIELASRLPGVAELSASVFEITHAHALLAFPPASGAANPGPLSRVAAALLALTPPSPDVIIVQAEGARPPGSGDCTIITDEIRLRGVSSKLGERLAESLEKLGIRSQLHTQYDSETTEPPSRHVELLRVRAKGDFVTLRIGPELRERFRSVPLASRQQLLFERLQVPVRSEALAPLLAAACSPSSATGGTLSAAARKELLLDARTLATTRHPALLERLRARAAANHLALTVIEDGTLGDAYVVLSGTQVSLAIPLRSQVTGAVALSCSGDVKASIEKAQAARAESITVGAP